MSKIYEALKRLEWERAAYRASQQGTPIAKTRIRGSRIWWTGGLAGCVVGFGIGIAAMAGTPRWRAASPETAVTPPAPSPAVAATMPAEAAALPQAVVADVRQPEAIPTPEPPVAEPAASPAPSPPGAATVAEQPSIVPEAAPATVPAMFAIQVGTFRSPANAARLATLLEAESHRVTIEAGPPDGALWVVRVGNYLDRREAEAARTRLARRGLPGLLVSARPEAESEDASRHARAAGE
jgi:cell division protein FtsN